MATEFFIDSYIELYLYVKSYYSTFLYTIATVIIHFKTSYYLDKIQLKDREER